MFKKIHNIYINICLALLKSIDPYNKPLGRPNKYDYRFYITNILHITITGMSWKNLALIKSIKTDLIRKKFIKWSKLNIFTKANSIIMKQYKKNI